MNARAAFIQSSPSGPSGSLFPAPGWRLDLRTLNPVSTSARILFLPMPSHAEVDCRFENGDAVRLHGFYVVLGDQCPILKSTLQLINCESQRISAMVAVPFEDRDGFDCSQEQARSRWR